MSTREQRTRRVLALQVQLHRVEHWKLLDLQRRGAELDAQRRELIAALNDSDALQGLFLDATARRLMARDWRYLWVGERPRGQARRLLARSRLLVLSSRMEGGANVVSEALVEHVPVLASRIPGSVGLLGARYPGFLRNVSEFHSAVVAIQAVVKLRRVLLE